MPRLVLDNYRSSLDWWLVPLAKALRRVEPNTITWVSLCVAVVGGIAFWQSSPDRLWSLWLAWVCVCVNGILDVLDGKVAVLTGRTSPKGDYLDHAVDRFSDAFFLVGIAFSPWGRVEVGLLAVTFTLLTSYLGTQAQAVGIGRQYGGLLGRADRMVLLMAAPLLQAVLATAGVATDWSPWAVSVLDAALVYIAATGVVTTVQRFVSAMRSFDSSGRVR